MAARILSDHRVIASVCVSELTNALTTDNFHGEREMCSENIKRVTNEAKVGRVSAVKCIESYSFWHHIKQVAVNKFCVINISLSVENDTFAGCTFRLKVKQNETESNGIRCIIVLSK